MTSALNILGSDCLGEKDEFFDDEEFLMNAIV